VGRGRTKTYLPFPRKLPPVSLKTKLYPINHHCTDTMARERMDRNSRVKAFFLLVKPEYR
jgi:hypothetical protein